MTIYFNLVVMRLWLLKIDRNLWVKQNHQFCDLDNGLLLTKIEKSNEGGTLNEFGRLIHFNSLEINRLKMKNAVNIARI